MVLTLHVCVPVCVCFPGPRHALLAQTQHREVSGRPAQLHPVPGRVDGGGQGAVRTSLQLPREELPPHPADGNAHGDNATLHRDVTRAATSSRFIDRELITNYFENAKYLLVMILSHV